MDAGWTREIPGFAVFFVALLALLWSCRGAPLGVPAADDYDYLDALQRPVDPFGALGSIWYWRPLSRQLYYAALDGAFLHAPVVVAVVHAALLALFFLFAYRAARAAFDPWGAAAIAAFPLLAEPTRELLAWPTAAQPLLAMVFLALALHEACARRPWTAALALLAALLSHEQALLGVAAVPLAFALRTKDRTRRLGMFGATALVTAVYLAGRLVAFGHGAGLPPRAPFAEALRAFPLVLAKSVDAQLGILTLAPGPRRAIALGVLGLVLAAVFLLARERRWPALPLAGAAWFALGVLPLAFAVELWTPRHTSLPSLGLAVALGGLVALASSRLAIALVVVRTAALLLAPTADALLSVKLAERTAPMSYLHVVRLQRTADSARRHLLAKHPTLPHGTGVRYWSLPRETQVAFAGAKAVRTWYADTTLTWEFWERYTPGVQRFREPILGFNVDVADPAVLMDPEAVRLYQQGIDAWEAGQLETAQESFAQAIATQRPEVHNFTNETVRLMARLAFMLGRFGQADSLNAVDFRMSGPTASSFGLEAMLAITAGDSARAEAAARRTLQLRPDDPDARAVLEALGTR